MNLRLSFCCYSDPSFRARMSEEDKRKKFNWPWLDPFDSLVATLFFFRRLDILDLRSSSASFSSSSLLSSSSSPLLWLLLLADLAPSTEVAVDGNSRDGRGEDLSRSSGVPRLAIGADIDVRRLPIWDTASLPSGESSAGSLFSYGSTFSLLQPLTLCWINLTMSHSLNSCWQSPHVIKSCCSCSAEIRK